MRVFRDEAAYLFQSLRYLGKRHTIRISTQLKYLNKTTVRCRVDKERQPPDGLHLSSVDGATTYPPYCIRIVKIIMITYLHTHTLDSLERKFKK